MALRTLHTTKVGAYSIAIQRDSEWDEYRVTTKVGGRITPHGGVYYTTDKRDARGTAAAEVRRIKKLPSCRRT